MGNREDDTTNTIDKRYRTDHEHIVEKLMMRKNHILGPKNDRP